MAEVVAEVVRMQATVAAEDAGKTLRRTLVTSPHSAGTVGAVAGDRARAARAGMTVHRVRADSRDRE